MYYVFRPAAVWPGMRTDTELLTPVKFSDYESSSWIAGVPLRRPLPPLTFAIEQAPLLLDQYWPSYRQVYSTRLAALISAAGVRCETFPVTLVDQRSKAVISKDYVLFHLLEIHPALDLTRSDLGDGQKLTEALDEVRRMGGVHNPEALAYLEEANRKYFGIHKLVVSDEYLRNPFPFFRPVGAEQLIFIHEMLKTTLEAEGITGCEYTPIDQYRVGWPQSVIKHNAEALLEDMPLLDHAHTLQERPFSPEERQDQERLMREQEPFLQAHLVAQDDPTMLIPTIAAAVDYYRNRPRRLRGGEARMIFATGYHLGQQICQHFGWEWVVLEYNERAIYAVVSPDRAFVIYPHHLLKQLIDDPQRPNPIMSLLEMLQQSALPERVAGAYRRLA